MVRAVEEARCCGEQRFVPIQPRGGPPRRRLTRPGWVDAAHLEPTSAPAQEAGGLGLAGDVEPLWRTVSAQSFDPCGACGPTRR